MFKVKLRKKLGMTIAGVLTTLIVYILAMKGIDVPDEMKLELTKYLMGIIMAGIGLFNIGQGIADMGKENGGSKK